MNRPALLVLAAFAGAGAASGCSGRSVVVIGGEPTGGTSSGGTPATAGVAPTGGVFATGGDVATGGVGVGGAFPTGGVPYGGTSTSTGGSVNGGTSTIAGGTSGATAEGGADGFDPYPPVAWDGGQGYRNACPQYADFWGFTCWNYVNDATGTRSCELDGEPYCNACSCSAPCESAPDCPYSVTGAKSDCIASATTAKSCFVVCDDEPCPSGMTCTSYPGVARRVCVWVAEEGPT